MEEVEISMSLSPDANRERLIKMYAYLNFYTFKLSKLDKTRH
jgi:hypothetical protein